MVNAPAVATGRRKWRRGQRGTEVSTSLRGGGGTSQTWAGQAPHDVSLSRVQRWAGAGL